MRRKRLLFQQAGSPVFTFSERIFFLSFYDLVKISPGNDIIALFIFPGKDLGEQAALSQFSVPFVIGFQMKVEKDQFPGTVFYRNPGFQDTPLQITGFHRPGKGFGKRQPSG